MVVVVIVVIVVVKDAVQGIVDRVKVDLGAHGRRETWARARRSIPCDGFGFRPGSGSGSDSGSVQRSRVRSGPVQVVDSRIPLAA
ncbi:hypothetical protein BC567DRAFT_224420 [Phyllosticta citribraziliensis]